MKILIAPDKFKGSLSAQEVCLAIERGIKRSHPNAATILLPMADGGDGSLEVLQHYLPLERITVEVADPLFRPVSATYLLGHGQAFIEMSAASGLVLLAPDERNALHTTSLGTGQLIMDAWQRGAREIFLFVGGSATNDGGIGMAQALGYQFLDKAGNPLSPIGKSLVDIARIDNQQLLINPATLQIKVLCDVNNPFYGPQGAAAIYGPQKGADPEDVAVLDRGLQQLNHVLSQQGYPNLSGVAGSGAAGGLAGGAMAFLDAQLESGIQFFQQLTRLDSHLQNVHWVFTGEGQLDAQTLEGKVISGVAALAEARQVPVVVICGAKQLEAMAGSSFRGVYAVMDISANLSEAMAEAEVKVEELAERAMQELII